MGTISNKNNALYDDNEETNNVQLEKKIYQQMNLIKLEDLNVLPLEEVIRKLDKSMVKWPLNMRLIKLEKNPIR